jgi:hypothetical protein
VLTSLASSHVGNAQDPSALPSPAPAEQQPTRAAAA